MHRRGLLVDVTVAAVAFAISALVVADAAPDPALRDADVFAYLLLAVYSFSVVGRWRTPLVAVALGFGAGLAYAAAGYPPALSPVALLAVYSAAVVLDARAGRWLLSAAVLVAAFGATLAPGPTSLGVPLVVAGAWLLGRSARDRRLYTEALEATNRELAQAQDELARQAVTEERLRIPRAARHRGPQPERRRCPRGNGATGRGAGRGSRRAGTGDYRDHDPGRAARDAPAPRGAARR